METLKNRIKLLYKFFEDMFYDICYDKKDGLYNPMTFSIGRTAFVVWFIVTVHKTLMQEPTEYLWYILGISLLSYVVGKQYIVTNLGISSTAVEAKDHP